MLGDKARKDYAMPNFMAMDEILKYLSDFMKRKHEGFPHQQLTRVPLEILK